MTVVAGPEPGDMRQPIRSRLRCRVLTRPEAVSVAMHDPPRPAASTPADVRHLSAVSPRDAPSTRPAFLSMSIE